MKRVNLKRLLLCVALTGFMAGNLNAQTYTYRQATEDEGKAIGIGGKNGTPIFADFDNNGAMDVANSGETFEWQPVAGETNEDGSQKWNWSWWDRAYVGFNNGDGTFTVKSRDKDDNDNLGIPVWYGGLGSRAFDFNQDGYTDFLVLSSQAGWQGLAKNALVLVVNNGDGTFTVKNDAALARCEPYNADCRVNGGKATSCLSVSDFNKDGYPDILFESEGNYNGGWARMVKLFVNKEGDHFEEHSFPFIPQSGGSVSFGDFNNDGWPDIVTTGWGDEATSMGAAGGGQMHLYRNTKDGNFELATTDIDADIAVAAKKWGTDGDAVLHVLDYDQDGKQDILCVGGVGGDKSGDKEWSQNNKRAIILRNVSTDDKFAFEEFESNIYPVSGAAERMSFLADFNGDGWVDYICKGWNGDWRTKISNSKGAYDTFDHNDLTDFTEFEGHTSYGDMNNDGLLEVVSCQANDRLTYNINTTEVSAIAVPGVPTDVAAAYDAAAKTMTVTWTGTATSTGSKAMYNVYMKNKMNGKVFMLAPADIESGKQRAYTEFCTYLVDTKYVFENVEVGDYEVGVQAVAYSWQASAFAKVDVNVPRTMGWRQATEDEGKAIGIGGKGGTPIFADFDNNGFIDVFNSGETFEWQPKPGETNEDGSQKWDWQWWDNNFIGFNNGDGTFTSKSNASEIGLPVYYGGLGSRAFDFNQDGYTDFLLASKATGWRGLAKDALILVINNGDGTFTTKNDPALSRIYPYTNDNALNKGQATSCLSVADVNKDGYPDIVFQSEVSIEGAWSRMTKVFINKEGDHFEESASSFIPQCSGSVSFGDFNNDGWPDIVSTGWCDGNTELGLGGGDYMHFYRNTKDGNFELATTDIDADIEVAGKKWASGSDVVLHVMDYDQDGKQDILCIGGVGGFVGNKENSKNGKVALLLRNVSTDEKFAFEEYETNIFPVGGAGERMSFLADFNGDGWVDYICKGWNGDWHTSASNSMAAYDSFESKDLSSDEFTEWEGRTTFGDLNNDGLLEVVSCQANDRLTYNINTTEVPAIAVPGIPTDVTAAYDAAAKTMTVTWTGTETSTGSKAMYNVYLKNRLNGKTFMLAPADAKTGMQRTYTAFSTYLVDTKYVFENVEMGDYEVGVQAVAYSWQASAFATAVYLAPAAAETLTLLSSKTFKVRDNKWSGTMDIEIKASDDGFCALYGFDLATIKEKMNSGYAVKDVKLTTTTKYVKGNMTFGIKPMPYSLDGLTKDDFNNNYKDEVKGLETLATVSCNYEYGQEPGTLHKNADLVTTDALECYDIAAYQQTMQDEKLTQYAKNVVNGSDNEIAFWFHGVEGSNNAYVFTHDATSVTWTKTTDKYVWNSDSHIWEKDSEAGQIPEFEQACAYFGMTAEELTAAVTPKLVVTMEPTERTDIDAPAAVTPDFSMMNYGYIPFTVTTNEPYILPNAEFDDWGGVVSLKGEAPYIVKKGSTEKVLEAMVSEGGTNQDLSIIFMSDGALGAGTYEFVLPARTYCCPETKDDFMNCVVSGFYNSEYRYEFTIKPSAIVQVYESTPAYGERVKSVKEVSVVLSTEATLNTEADAPVAYLQLVGSEDKIAYTSAAVDAENAKMITFTFDEITAEGDYNIIVPEKVFVTVDGDWNAEYMSQFEVNSHEAKVNGTITPSEETFETITMEQEFKVTFDAPVTLNENAPQQVIFRNRMAQVVAFMTLSENGTEATIKAGEEIETMGVYTLVIPEETVLDADGNWNFEITAAYTVTGKPAEYTMVPADGSEVTSLKEFTLTEAASCAIDANNSETIKLYNSEDVVVAEVATADFEDNAIQEGENFWDPVVGYKIVLKDEITAPGTYKLVIPAGMFIVTANDVANEELTFTYTVKDPTGIEAIIAVGKVVDVYTVNGVLVKKDAAADDLKSLKKGLYVIGGKTILVK